MGRWARWRRRLLRLLGWGALALGLMVGGFLAAAHLGPLPERLAVRDSTVVTWRDGTVAHVFLAEDDRWRIAPVDLDPAYVQALLRLEDKRFYDHPGVDAVAIVRAVVGNAVAGRRVSGASTLTMQLVRLLEPRPRTWRSKLVEAFRALQLEVHLSKAEILAHYLRFVPYGRNVEGVEAAALAYFGHRADALTPAEIATLLAVPQGPRTRAPRPGNAGVLRRARDNIAARLLAEDALHAVGQPTDPGVVLLQVHGAPVPTGYRPFPR
ncbi:MAG: transglycosylase domain-containing protein, partial [Myxococcales bacterium]|nr:transglycosylase domain-containing protein [Myxococcales bacterium]